MHHLATTWLVFLLLFFLVLFLDHPAAVTSFAFWTAVPPSFSPRCRSPNTDGRASATTFSLYAVLGNKNNNQNNNDAVDDTTTATKHKNDTTNVDTYGGDLNAWIHGLVQWPLSPTSKPVETTTTTLKQSEATARIPTENKNNRTDTDDDDIGDEDEDDDVNRWILNTLRQWPLLSRPSADSTSAAAASAVNNNASTTNTTTTTLPQQQQSALFDNTLEKNDASSQPTTATTSSFPLTRILNMEALLAFALQKSKESTSVVATGGNIKSNAADTRTNDTILSRETEENPLPPILDTLWQESTSTADALLSNISATISSIADTEDLMTAASNATGTTNAATQTMNTTTVAATPWWQRPFVSLIMGEPQVQQQQQPPLVFISPSQIQSLIKDATSVANMGVTNLAKVAQQMATERGWDVQDSVARAVDTTRFARKLVSTANDVLRVGYVQKKKNKKHQQRHDPQQQQQQQVRLVINNMTLPNAVILKNTTTSTTTTERALFDDFASAVELEAADLQYDAQMGALAGAIYENTIPKTKALGHTIVARGMTNQLVEWMVTDSLLPVAHSDDDGDTRGCEKDTQTSTQTKSAQLVRTLIVRGFDASDERVDREGLLNQICMATPESLTLGEKTDSDDNKEDTVSTKCTTTARILLHTGLRKIAKSIYQDVVKQYLVDWTCSQHKIVLSGHSIGGSLSLLVLLEMVLDQGKDYVLDKVHRVYTFGSPPVAVVAEDGGAAVRDNDERRSTSNCSVLAALGLPTSMVHAYVQPWDPIVRLFTTIDPLYPLVSDMGADGVTPWVNGPPRTLRPIIRQVAQAWEGWPRFRDTFRDFSSQNYTTVGTPHLLLPEPTRYLADRFVSVNIPTPSTDSVVRLGPNELHAALESLFPLDVFEISYVPQAIRSFVHHFYPSYEVTLIDYVKRLEEESHEVKLLSTAERRKQEGKSSRQTTAEKRTKSPQNNEAAFSVE